MATLFSGTPQNPYINDLTNQTITTGITTDGLHDAVILNGTFQTLPVTVTNAHNVKFYGTRFFSMTGAALNIHGGDQINLRTFNNIVQSCTFDTINGTYAAVIDGSGGAFLQCIAFNCLGRAFQLGGQVGSQITCGANNSIIDGCIMYNCVLGINDCGAIYLGNFHFGVGQGGNVIRNNIIYNCGFATGTLIHGIYADNHHGNSYFINNTIYNLIGNQAQGMATAGSAVTGIFINGGRDNVLDGNVITNMPTGLWFLDRHLDSPYPQVGLSTWVANPIYQQLYPTMYGMTTSTTTISNQLCYAGDDPGWPKGNVVQNNNLTNCVCPCSVSSTFGIHTVANYFGPRNSLIIAWNNNTVA